MNENHNFNFVYTVIPDDNDELYSVCCLDEKGIKIKVIDAVGKKEEAEEFCNFLNEGKVYPCHFENIYEDYFG